MMSTTTVPLAHTDAGTGDPALLYLPGWCGGREVFDPLLAATSRTRRAVSVDWPGHGGTPAPEHDFDSADLVLAALDLVDRLALARVVPVALSHAGWPALELRRRLGPDRVPAVVLMDWMPLGAPPQFGGAVAALQEPGAWTAARAGLFGMWGDGVDDPAVHAYIASMGAYGFDMWSRAGREIERAFAAEPVPLAAFAELPQATPTLHVYAQPRDDGYLAAQQAYAAGHPWFRVRRLDATSHFPCLEAPAQVAAVLDDFLADVP